MTAAALTRALGLPLFTIHLAGLITKYTSKTTAKLRVVFDAIQSTLANAGDGLLVVDVRTERQTNQLAEVATQIRPVRKDLVDADGYRGYRSQLGNIAGGRYGPSLVPQRRDPTALFAIHVPAQPGRLKPFVLRRVVGNTDAVIQTFSMLRRNEDQTGGLSAEHVQSQLPLMTLLGSSGGLTLVTRMTNGITSTNSFTALIREFDASDEPVLGAQIIPPSPNAIVAVSGQV